MNTVLFDLDGTLLPMDVDEFTHKYIGGIIEMMNHKGRDGQLIAKAMFKGVGALYKSDGSLINEDLFWSVFEQVAHVSKEDIEDDFMEYYETIFDDIDTGIRSENMIEAVNILKSKGYKLYLTTNPLFPSIATNKRITWAGLKSDDFELITTYENCHFCKPDLRYYQEVIDLHHLDKHKCLMVGNNVLEDGIVETLGIPVYLVNDYLINKENQDITCTYLGSSNDFLEFVKKLEEVK